ncbi:MAG TPA: ChaN family lipoprotein [Candidatus Deferrimicrobium sp.]|nr:ChaN family lipoprotein [Candidatus Deferrimicrobium sp.]
MKLTKTFLSFLVLASALTWEASLLNAEINQDILPLGPSKFKFIIAKIEKDQIIQTASGNTITLENIIEQNKDTDVFIIGEAHDNYQCHTFQRDFIRALFKKYPKLVVGFEFFQRDDNPVLEDWRTGKISEEEVIKKTAWYKRGGQDYRFTRLIMDVIKENNIKTIGLNVPREILRTVSRKGFENLSKEEKALFPTIHIPNTEHEYFIKSIFGTFAAQVPMWFNNIYNAQKCWDVVMAESMRQTLTRLEFKGYKGVIIAGSNHVAYQLGIPFRYRAAQPNVKITTIVPILLPEEKTKDENEGQEVNPMMKMMAQSLAPASTFSRGIADYVFSVEQPKDSYFPVIGFTTVEKEGKLIVTDVAKESIAEKNGIKKDDQIIAVDGVDVSTLEQMRLIITQKNWGDAIDLKMIKKIPVIKEDKSETGKSKEEANRKP